MKLTEERAQSLILKALETVKDSDSAYGSLKLNGQTVILGRSSPFDSIAFTAFATDFEERIEDETGLPYVLRVDEIYRLHGKGAGIRVADMAKYVTQLIERTPARA